MKKLLIVIVVILFMILVPVFFNKNTGTENQNYFVEIDEKIKNKDTFIILVYDSAPNEPENEFCIHCEEGVTLLNYYHELYNLDVFYFDKYKTTKDDYDELVKYFSKYFDLNAGYLPIPTSILIKDGEWKSAVSYCHVENDLKSALVDYKFIDENDSKVEKQINSENYKNIIKEDKYSFIVFHNYEKESILYRKKLVDLSKKYKFTYYTVYDGLAVNTDIIVDFLDKYKDDLMVPSIGVVGKNEIIDYSSSRKEEDLISFIEKYNK